MALPTLRAGSSGETGGGFPKPSGVTAGNTFNLTIRSGFRAAFFLASGRKPIARLVNFADIYGPKFLRWE
jgi:hypothetical protein